MFAVGIAARPRLDAPELVVLDMGVPVFEVVVACVALGCNTAKLVAIDSSEFGCTELVPMGGTPKPRL